MQATDEQVGDTETDAPPLVNSIRKSTQKKVSALARLGAWGLPPDEAAPRSSHDHEDAAMQQALGSRPGSRSSAGSRERKGWSGRPSSRDASYAGWSRGGLQVPRPSPRDRFPEPRSLVLFMTSSERWQGKTKIAMIQTPRDGMLGENLINEDASLNASRADA